MSNDNNSVQLTENPNIVTQEVGDNVIALERHNEAITYLRRKDIEMLTTLRDHLAENIRLHAILEAIKSEIARLQALLKTPKPKIKIALIIAGIIVAIGGMLIFSDTNMVGFYGSLIIGIVLVVLSIVLKVRDTKKWAAFIEETRAKIAAEEQKAVEAQNNIDNYWNNHAAPFIASIIPDRFPKDYVLQYDTVCGMLNIMENLRADNIKEAINLYDELHFKADMRSAFRNMEASLYSAARSAERSAAAAERSAAANESAAVSAAAMAVNTARMAKASEKAANASAEASRAIRDRMNRD